MSPTPRSHLHHVELWVPDINGATRSWGWLLTELGYQPLQHFLPSPVGAGALLRHGCCPASHACAAGAVPLEDTRRRQPQLEAILKQSNWRV